MVEYFLVKINSIRMENIEEMLDLLEKALKMFHSNHYVVTRLRINLSMAYLELAGRMGLEPHKVPAELHLKRKEFLDEVHKVVEAVEPGLSRRRGKLIRVFVSSKLPTWLKTSHLRIVPLRGRHLPSSNWETSSRTGPIFDSRLHHTVQHRNRIVEGRYLSWVH